MTTAIISDIDARGISLPARPFSSTLKSIFAIQGLTGLWEAEDISTVNGFRWKPKWGANELVPYRNLPPVVVTGSHGKPAIQTGFGNAAFASTDRGGVCVGESASSFGAGGCTLIMAFRCASALDTGGVIGGYLCAGRNETGANPDLTVTPDDTDFRLVVQSSTGRPRLRGGGATVEAAVDLISVSAWHILTASFDDVTNVLALRVDGGGTTASVTASGSMPAHSGALAPLFGIFNHAAPLPFYGAISGIATADRNLALADKQSIEARFGALYGVTIT